MQPGKFVGWSFVGVISTGAVVLFAAVFLLGVKNLWPDLADVIDKYQSLIGAMIAIPVAGLAVHATLRPR
jgi:hypothetical protein